MKRFYFICFKVLRMPIFLILLGLVAFIGGFFLPRALLMVLLIIMSAISMFIQFFTDTYFFKRGMQTALLGIGMLSVLFIAGYESNIWIYVMQGVGLGASLFFLLDVDEQLTNYHRLRKKSIEHLTTQRVYKKLATSRCSMDMYFSTLDVVSEKEISDIKKNEQMLLQRNKKIQSIREGVFFTKEEMTNLYKPCFFFPKTSERLWIKKLKELLGNDPKGKRRKKLNKT